ncbi:hypothetical protein [Antarctobacter sp.]|uniref:hypothetical protein n=1 Tax=Antarctobacter sp. TaxID=1872577 RepID=UPI002B266EF2|nr:hypothetical protein [Antarctobacter sp.]
MVYARILALVGLGLATPALAADFSDPTWPCIQRKVERLSVGLMWANPVPETLPDDLRHDVQALASKLAVRRIALEELRPDVAAFAQAHDGDADVLGLVFEQVFDRLSRRRSRIITGIGDFSQSQIALSEKIEAARTEMTAQMAKAEPDFDRVDALEEQLDWDQLIYSDRQQNITYLCETPTLLEKRLFGIAQMLQAEVRDN